MPHFLLAGVIQYVEALTDERDREDAIRLAAETLGYTFDALHGLVEEYRTRWQREEMERQLQRYLADSLRRLQDHESSAATLVRDLSSTLASLQAQTVDAPPAVLVERLEAESRRVPVGKPSGWSALDCLECRFNAGELAVLGARTGHGKTTIQIGLLVNWLFAAEANPDELFLLYSMEEPEVRVYHRLLSVVSARMGEGWGPNDVRDFLRDPHGRPNWPAPPAALARARERLRSWEERLLIVRRPTGPSTFSLPARGTGRSSGGWARSWWTTCSGCRVPPMTATTGATWK